MDIEKENRLLKRAAVILEKRFCARGMQFTGPDTVKLFLTMKLAIETEEVFGLVFLDNHNRFITTEVIYQGSISSCVVPSRTLVRRVLYHNAAAIIIFHNHPSGVPEFSKEDINLTVTMKEIMKTVEVTLLDHILVAGTTAVSYAETRPI